MDLSYIGQRITELRILHNVSEYQMSLELGQSKSYIQAITSGKMLPSLKQLFNICDYFGISLSEFFDTSKDNPVKIQQITDQLKSLSPQDLELVSILLSRLPKKE